MLYFIDFIVLVEQNLEFDNILFTNEINKIKENLKKIKALKGRTNFPFIPSKLYENSFVSIF